MDTSNEIEDTLTCLSLTNQLGRFDLINVRSLDKALDTLTAGRSDTRTHRLDFHQIE